MSNVPFIWSEHQNAIFSSCTEDLAASYIVDSCAGSSKTTTMVELVRRLVEDAAVQPGTIMCLAFNKSIATTLSERMPPGVRCSTMNALGHGALRSFLPAPRLQVSGYKEHNIWRSVPGFEALERADQKAIIDAYLGVKQAGILPALDRFSYGLVQATLDPKPEVVEKAAFRYWPDAQSASSLFRQHLGANSMELDPRDWTEAFAEVFTMDLYQSLAHGSISFLDQLFLPTVLKNVSLPTAMHVVVDEAQDLGFLEHELLGKIVSRFPRGRLIAVGDRAQAIYAFKGAHYDSLDRLAARFDAAWLALPVSFRCPQTVVAEAARFDSRIQPWTEAPTGSVERLPSSWTIHDIPRGAAVLCRMNYPLVGLGLDLIRAGIGCKFLGKDFEERLMNFFTQWKKKSKILHGMFMAIRAEIRDLEDKGNERKASMIEDNLECLEAIADHYGVDDFAGVENGIRTLFNSPGPIFLSTIHKAKGLEWPHVYLLRPDMCPSPRAKNEEDLRQEYNMLYVAITRAQQSFTYLAPPTGGQ